MRADVRQETTDHFRWPELRVQLVSLACTPAPTGHRLRPPRQHPQAGTVADIAPSGFHLTDPVCPSCGRPRPRFPRPNDLVLDWAALPIAKFSGWTTVAVPGDWPMAYMQGPLQPGETGAIRTKRQTIDRQTSPFPALDEPLLTPKPLNRVRASRGFLRKAYSTRRWPMCPLETPGALQVTTPVAPISTGISPGALADN